jgi:trimeric autotransporter adhesin
VVLIPQSVLIALYSNTTASNNTAVGYHALSSNTDRHTILRWVRTQERLYTTGIRNTTVGDASLDADNAGNYSTAMGYGALSVQSTAGGYGCI